MAVLADVVYHGGYGRTADRVRGEGTAETRHAALDRPVAYPFGHGLSYCTFSHRHLRIACIGAADAGDLAVTVRCTVLNTPATARGRRSSSPTSATRRAGRHCATPWAPGPDGRPAGILGSEELLTIIENMPLSALATFSGLGVTDELIGRLVRAVGERHAEASPGA